MQPETLTETMIREGNEQEAPAKTPVQERINPTPATLYDAEAEQKMSFQTERKGRMYSVTHIFGPIKDDKVIAYERTRDQRITDAETSESDTKDAMAITSKGYAAAIEYWNNTDTKTEGYAGKVSDKDKAFAVQNLLFAVEFEELPLATGEELCPEEDDDTSTLKLRCLFDGQVVTTSATLRAATPGEISDFQILMSRTLLVQGTQFGQRDQRIPSKAKRLGELFDLVKVSVTGYAGRVPLHHKMAFALRHFRAEQKASTGN